MGMLIGFSNSSFDDSKQIINTPDTNKWVINKSIMIGKYLLIDITYPNCTNYEGKKFLLFENILKEDLVKQKKIDPHFFNNKNYYSPIARFEPTKKGWEMAKILMNSLIKFL